MLDKDADVIVSNSKQKTFDSATVISIQKLLNKLQHPKQMLYYY